MAGRRPKPTAIKIAQGNPGKRKINELEPQPEPGEGLPPGMLSKRGKRIWSELAPMLLANKVLTVADHTGLGLFCLQAAQAEELAQEISKKGILVKGVLRDGQGRKIGDTKVVHPGFRALTHLVKEVRSWLLEFGMTPASRTKVTKVVRPEELKKDPLGELRARVKRNH